MILAQRYHTEADLSCDGCSSRLTVAGDSLKAALDRAREQGWQPSQWPRWYCSQCRPPEVSSGKGTTVTQDRDGKTVVRGG